MRGSPRREGAGLGSVLPDEKTGCHAKPPQAPREQQGGPALPYSLAPPSIPGTGLGTSQFLVYVGKQCDREEIQWNNEVSNSNNQS